MGVKSLPSAGLIYLDASVIIYGVQRHPEFGPPLRSLWSAVKAGTLHAITSELTVLECLVVPLRQQDDALTQQFELALNGDDFSVRPVDSEILRAAAHFRAQIPALRTPDAIHVATAMTCGATALLTNDATLARLCPIKTILIRDLVTPPETA